MGTHCDTEMHVKPGFETRQLTENQALAVHPCKWPIMVDIGRNIITSIRATSLSPVPDEPNMVYYDVPPRFLSWDAVIHTAETKALVRVLMSDVETKNVLDMGEFVVQPFTDVRPGRIALLRISDGTVPDEMQPTTMWKCQETLYNSVLFKSKLEAETALFMDLAKIQYWYQPDVLHLPNINGTESWKYKPDFYLPDLQLYLEIKPAYPLIEEKMRCEALAKRGFRAALMYGRPKQGDWHEKKNRVYFGSDAQRGMLYLPPDGVPALGELNWVEQPNGQITLDLVTKANDARNRTPALQAIWDKIRTHRFEL